MAYTHPMRPSIPTVVVELPSFSRAAKDLLTIDQVDAIITTVASDPGAGVLLEGTGGFRKIRFAVGNRGKSGGVRVIYFFHSLEMPVYLVAVFAKNESANLTKAESNALYVVGQQIVASWRTRVR